jgi:hypothetical protein
MPNASWAICDQPARARYHVTRDQLDDRQGDRRAGKEGCQRSGQRAQAVSSDVQAVVEAEHDERDQERTDRGQHVTDGFDTTPDHGQRADKQAKRRGPDEAQQRGLQDQRQSNALNRVPQDGEPHWKSLVQVLNSVKFGDAVLGADCSLRCLRHQLGQREGLVVAQVEIGVTDIQAVAGGAADLDVVRQREELVVEAVGLRGGRHHVVHHGGRVVGGGHRGPERGNESRSRVSVDVLGRHGRRLLRDVT